MDSEASRPVVEERRRPHASLDLDSRSVKARKIERLLGLVERERPVRLLEVGCGGGGIAAHFSQKPNYDVTGIDVVDQRQAPSRYTFVQVDDVVLPFPGNSFDVVISNHVIEHVGDRASQRTHLRELARVLRPDGVGYLAVPNRWAVIEPHFQIPFVSWLPNSLRTPYLRLLKGTHYDCNPLGPVELDVLLLEARLAHEAVEAEALQAMLDLGELRGALAACVRLCPGMIRRAAQPLMPTLIRRLRHA